MFFLFLLRKKKRKWLLMLYLILIGIFLCMCVLTFICVVNHIQIEVVSLVLSSWFCRKKVLVNHEKSNIIITGDCNIGDHAWLNDEVILDRWISDQIHMYVSKISLMISLLQVINIYLELLKDRERREPKKFLKCHFFNTFFYKKVVSPVIFPSYF